MHSATFVFNRNETKRISDDVWSYEKVVISVSRATTGAESDVEVCFHFVSFRPFRFVS